MYDRIEENIPCIIVGNKVDLTQQREIYPAEIEKKYKKNNPPIFETSALDNINIHESFEHLIRLIITKQKAPKKTTSPKKRKCIIL